MTAEKFDEVGSVSLCPPVCLGGDFIYLCSAAPRLELFYNINLDEVCLIKCIFILVL